MVAGAAYNVTPWLLFRLILGCGLQVLDGQAQRQLGLEVVAEGEPNSRSSSGIASQAR